MAGHLSLTHRDLEDLELSYLKSHLDAIKKHTEKGLVHLRGSFLFEDLDKDYKISENDEVFMHIRKIKKQSETFEIHYDKKEKKLIDVFLVK